MTPVLELLTKWFPNSWKDPLAFPLRETKEKPNEALLTTEEASEYLAISSETLRRLRRRKAITFIAVGSEYRFVQDDLKEYVASRRNRRKSSLYR
jgi:excisionase family DNA binding protein